MTSPPSLKYEKGWKIALPPLFSIDRSFREFLKMVDEAYSMGPGVELIWLSNCLRKA